MGNCEVCSKEMEYNAIDSDDLMQKLDNTEIGKAIMALKKDNQDSLGNCKFVPMPDRSFFKGRLKDTHREGYGQNYANCFNYFGYFKNDLPHGKGAIITDYQATYGNFMDGVLDGKGKEWRDGVSFDGTFCRGERLEGNLVSQGCSYSGAFKDRLYHGKGTLVMKNGLAYKGQFVGGKFHGQGEVTFEAGCKYKGKFKDGLYDGYGQFTWPNGNTYKGQYKDGKRHGFGTLKIGDIEYSGNWSKGVREGHGTLTQEKEFAFGTWNNNMLVED